MFSGNRKYRIMGMSFLLNFIQPRTKILTHFVMEYHQLHLKENSVITNHEKFIWDSIKKRLPKCLLNFVFLSDFCVSNNGNYIFVNESSHRIEVTRKITEKNLKDVKWRPILDNELRYSMGNRNNLTMEMGNLRVEGLRKTYSVDVEEYDPGYVTAGLFTLISEKNEECYIGLGNKFLMLNRSKGAVYLEGVGNNHDMVSSTLWKFDECKISNPSKHITNNNLT